MTHITQLIKDLLFEEYPKVKDILKDKKAVTRYENQLCTDYGTDIYYFGNKEIFTIK